MSILKRGMKGAPVRRLQQHLGIEADGDFGPATEKAVREFQERQGIAVDGIAGPDTFSALGLHELILLRRGSRGPQVKRLQKALGIDADGAFGPGTEKAVKEFQKTHGLDEDGMAGPETLAELGAFEEFTPKVVENAKPLPEEKEFEGEPLPEIKGAQVVKSAETIDVPEEKSVWGKVKGWFS